uniref:Uncharacterized protein n=1 Tax=Coniophora puteana TaxID=80637 RepID=A0A896Z1V6_9AGAM
MSTSSVISPVFMLPFINVLSGYWSDCLKNVDKMSRFYKLFRVSLFISSFPSIIFRAIRIIIGLVISSLAVLFSPDEMVGGFLKDVCYSFIEFIESISPFRFIPRFSPAEASPVISETDTATSETYSITGMVLLGATVITVPLCLINYFFPGFIKGLPVIGNPIDIYTTYVNSFTSNLYTLIYDYFFGGDSEGQAPQIPQPTEKELAETSRGTPPYERPLRVPHPSMNRSEFGMKRGFLNGQSRRTSNLRNDITDSIAS